ncbi:MaoC family dehydratase [Afipia sp. DC4300-2b1]|uniref:MaoC family dehydratase n=1 Tax=Afipia sp. DC4300-2b1 TaxID=2804672 RepID=UPI003CF8926C
MTASAFLPPIDERYFEDYIVGANYEFGPIEAEEQEIISFAKRFDPQTMHLDPVKAKDGRYGGLIASGWHTVSLMMRLFVQNYLSAIASHASPGVDEIRWFQPVRPGDRLLLRVSVLHAKVSRTKPDRGVIISLVEALNQSDLVVCSFKAVNLFARRNS